MSTGLPDQPGSAEPGLSHLFRALTADGHPHELANRDEALAMFRDAVRTPRRRGFPRTRPAGSRPASPWPTRRLPGRLVTVAVAGGLAVAGVTAAAYAQALPAPVQQIAYSVFAPLGVPNSTPQPAGQPGSGNPATAPGTTQAPSPGALPGTAQASAGLSASPTPTASGTPAGGYVLTLAATRAIVPSGGFDIFTGRLTRHGQPAGGIRVRLLERVAGSAGWQLAAAGRSGPRGGVTFTVPHLTTTATFRLAGPDGVHSAPVTVTVRPRLTVRLQVAAGQSSDQLTATAPDGQPGDAVRLAELLGGTWRAITEAPLGTSQTVRFTLPASSAGGHFYRAVLLKTSAHPAERSAPVWIPRRHTGAKVIGTPAPSVTPTPTASPTPSGTPTPTASLASPSPSVSIPASPTPTGHRHRGRRPS